jgi:hypothetical protein
MSYTETYDKVYFNDNYKEQFEALRAHYRARTSNALKGRKIDHDPMPNATTVVYLHDIDDGGCHVTTGDFVEYFNRRFGGNDRIGAMRRSVSNAARKTEMRRMTEEKQGRAAKARHTSKGIRPLRSVRPAFSFMNAVFALILVLSIGILGGTSLLLGNTEANVMALEEEVAMLETTRGSVVAYQYNATTEGALAEYPSMDGADSVEIYPAQNGGGVEMAALLNALASLGK